MEIDRGGGAALMVSNRGSALLGMLAMPDGDSGSGASWSTVGLLGAGPRALFDGHSRAAVGHRRAVERS